MAIKPNEMTTPANGQTPEIEWQRDIIIERPDDHVVVYAAFGESEDGRKWVADWTVVDGHFIEIDNIEETE